GSGISSDATQVNVRADSGPFTVTQPTSGANWVTGTTQTITWNVANTNLPPINCDKVQILLTNVLSFPIVLADNTPNDGSETVTLPVINTFSNPYSARIKVVAKGNVFFNISPSFTIFAPANSMQFSASNYSGSESDNPKQINVTVTRTGDTSGGAVANYATSDQSFGEPCNSVF